MFSQKNISTYRVTLLIIEKCDITNTNISNINKL